MTTEKGSTVRRATLFSAFVLCFVLASSDMLKTAQSQEIRFFRIGAGPTGSSDFVVGSQIANVISNPPGSPPCERGGSCGVPGMIAVTQATAGAIENIELLRSGGVEAALMQANVARWAFEGSGPFSGHPPFRDLRAIAGLYTQTLHLVTRADSPIKTPADLRGRTAAIGESGSGTLAIARLVFEAYGLSDKTMRPMYLRPGPAVDALIDGGVDAVFIVNGTPIPAISELADKTPIRLIPFNDAVAQRLLRPPLALTPTTIAKDVYNGASTSTPTLGVTALLAVRADFDSSVVHDLVRGLWHENSRRLLYETREATTKNLTIPLHSGAEQYYREAESEHSFP
ncbi:Immunogenic protein [Azospirillaceae bacterium]